MIAHPRVIRWLAAVISGVALFLACWIFLPAPTYFLLTFGVGAPEVSAWLLVGAAVGIALALRDVQRSRVARIAVAAGVIALCLASTPFLRLHSTIAHFDDEMDGFMAVPRSPQRAHPVVAADLFRGIPSRSARVQHGIRFGAPDGIPLTLDVYRPMRAGVYPIVVQIYGGAWQRGTPLNNANFSEWLAASGYVVIAVDYRHAPRSRWPDQLDDIDSSLVWIREHATAYGGDTARVVLLGRSAGAHLAMMAAYRRPPLRVRGVVSYYGPAYLADAYAHPPRPDPLDIRSTEIALLGAPPSTMPARYADASPISFLNHPQPATLLIQGGRDHIVEAEYGPRLREALVRSGSYVAYLEIPWAEHAFDAVFNGPSSQLALYYTERFIAWAVEH